MLKPTLHLLKLENTPIFKQLQLEEALLRLDRRNWCLLNTGSAPAIVMGISGNPDLLINQNIFFQKPVPVIRRFSGGGTVFVNEDTCFTTFICNHLDTQVACSPEAIFNWSEKIYSSVFQNFPFKLQENDYVIGDQKFGGNAQYLRQNRWLHHSSLLFNYDIDQMSYLTIPKKVPKYRKMRNHLEFLCKLNTFFPSKEHLRGKIESSLHDYFLIKEMKLPNIEHLLDEPHRKTTTFINFERQNL